MNRIARIVAVLTIVVAAGAEPAWGQAEVLPFPSTIERPVPGRGEFTLPFPRQVRPPTDPAVELIQSWYGRYLRRPADVPGLSAFVDQFRRGASPLELQANIVGSAEYYRLHGTDPVGFVVGLYQDVLGRSPNRFEVDHWLIALQRARGDRVRLARQFFTAAQPELSRQASGGYFPNP